MHVRLGEPIDEACRQAGRDYDRQYRAANPQARERDRRRSVTRTRALERLGTAYPEQFSKMLAEERAAWDLLHPAVT